MYGPGSSFLFPGCIAAGKLHPKFNNFKSGPYIRQKSTAFLSFFHKQGVRAPKSRPKSSLKPRRSSPPPPPAQKSAQTKAKSTSKKPAHQVFWCADSNLYSMLALCLLLIYFLWSIRLASLGSRTFHVFPWPRGITPRLYSSSSSSLGSSSRMVMRSFVITRSLTSSMR